MIKAIIFDFDGVIVESAHIKTEAFARLFAAHPHVVGAIVEYHVANTGVSRYEKFRHIYRNILRLPLSLEEEEGLGRRFSEIVLEQVVSAPLVAGVESFLVNAAEPYTLFVASGTPHEELVSIMERRKIADRFREIHGSPASKETIVRSIMGRYGFHPNEVVLVGDALTDRNAAEACGITFIARLTDDNRHLLSDSVYAVADIYGLKPVLAAIGGNERKMEK